MAERKNRDQNTSSDSSVQRDQNYSKSDQTQNISNEEQDPNPQDGNQWNNYQTRELSDEGSGQRSHPGAGAE